MDWGLTDVSNGTIIWS